MKNYLTLNELNELSQRLCRKLNAKAPSYAALSEMYFSPTGEQIIINSVEARIWIDKYYMAYALKDKLIHYVYISRRHIEEENEGLRELEQERGLRLYLQDEIREAFARAMKEMKEKGTGYAVRDEPASRSEG